MTSHRLDAIRFDEQYSRQMHPRLVVVVAVIFAAVLVAPRDARVLDPGSWLHNGHFDTTVAGWEFGPWQGATLSWSLDDAPPAEDSGAARIAIQQDTIVNVWAAQCRPVPVGAHVASLSGTVRYLVDSGDSNAWLQAAFYDDPGCAGTFLGDLGGSVHEPSNWTEISATDFIPDGARSVEVRLGLLKHTTAAPLHADFDDIRLAFDHMPSYRAVVPGLARG